MSQANLSDKVRLDGFFTTAVLMKSGISRSTIRALIRSGDLLALSRGVYVGAEFATRLCVLEAGELAMRAAAALATSAPGSVASHHTAAGLHGLATLDAPAVVAITRPLSANRSAKPGVHVHAARLPRAHVTSQLMVPATTVARTVTDLARIASFRDGVVTADSALFQNLTTKVRLRQVLAECARMPGAERAAEVIEFADGLSESALESIGRVAFRDLGLPPPVLQAPIGSPQIFARPDYLWRQYWTIAEADGALKYDDRNRAVLQLRRDEMLREAGFEIVHFGWREIMRAPDEVAASIRAAFRRGARSHGADDPAS